VGPSLLVDGEASLSCAERFDFAAPIVSTCGTLRMLFMWAGRAFTQGKKVMVSAAQKSSSIASASEVS
jgi:hypothetical protein